MKQIIAAALLSICLVSFAAYGDQHDEANAIIDEFGVLFEGVQDVGIIVNISTKFGVVLHGVNQSPDEMCILLKKVAPSLQYVIIDHNRTSGIQVYKECN